MSYMCILPERTLHAPPMNLLSTWFNPPFFPSPPSFLPPLSSFRLLRVPLSQRPAPAAMTPNSNALEVAHVPLLVHSMASSEGVPRLVPRLPVFKPSTPTSQDVPRRHVQPLTLRAPLEVEFFKFLPRVVCSEIGFYKPIFEHTTRGRNS